MAHIDKSDRIINLDDKLTEIQVRKELLELQLEIETQGLMLEDLERITKQNNELLKFLVSIFTPHEKN